MPIKQSKFPFYRYLAPRYWATWIMLTCLRLAIILPFPVAISIGRNIGRLLSWIPGKAKKIAIINVTRCFPELTSKQVKHRVNQHFQSMGIGLIEMVMCWWAAEKKLLPRTQIEGLQHLQKVLDGQQGAILLTAHLTTIEIGGTLINHYIPTGVMYRDQKNALFNALMVRARERNCPDLIHRNNIKLVLRYLRRHQPVWYAPDQNYSGSQSVFADFFGIPAATTSATARLASKTGSRVLPFYQIRLADNKGYKIIIKPPLENFPQGNIQQDTATVNLALENIVRAAPDQYLWSHRRFKNRPDNDKSFY
ncbi:Lipid A biosynthesis lauroyl acyltransferase [hydrothermal vent metagenome]|uniref:Lipid A biosynthesis lauroyl acyltransferase n=1 Tax=hydrothermal vent metagenome TaxID=652676 RepID=A0A3B0YJS6_9ZZZZ